MQRRDLVVELLAALVEAAGTIGQHLGQGLRRDAPTLPARQLSGDLQQGQRTAHVAVGGGRNFQQQLGSDLDVLFTQAAFAVTQRTLQRLNDVCGRNAFQHVHAATRQQRRIQLERWILGGGTDEQDGATLDMRQERILLRLVEAVHLIHEQHGAAAFGEALRGLGQHLAHLRQAGQYGRDGAEFRIGVLGQQQRQRGLAAARRPPQDHRMHATGFDRAAQRTVRRQQALLPDHFVQGAGAHALGQRAHVFPIDAQQIGSGE